jgi:endoglucanase
MALGVVRSRSWFVVLIALVLAAASECSNTQSINPFAGETFYVDPDSHAKQQVDEWRTSRPEDALQTEKIADQPTTYYFGEWTENTSEGTLGQVDRRVSLITETGTLPVLGAYAIPDRDCGAYSSGGFTTGEQYKKWIRDVATGIGDRKAVVILEPDALASVSCLSVVEQWTRFALIEDAVTVLKAQPKVSVYIDGGHPEWHYAITMALRLKSAGIEKADGFFLNASNFFYTSDNIRYGERISFLVGGKHFVIDTSRNGNGPTSDHDWCNPPGRALGERPTADTDHPLVDAYFWLKSPGQSDGECKGFPPAGTWVPEYALGLAQRAAY